MSPIQALDYQIEMNERESMAHWRAYAQAWGEQNELEMAEASLRMNTVDNATEKLRAMRRELEVII